VLERTGLANSRHFGFSQLITSTKVISMANQLLIFVVPSLDLGADCASYLIIKAVAEIVLTPRTGLTLDTVR